MTGVHLSTAARPGVDQIELGARVVDALCEESDRLAVATVRAIAVRSRCELAMLRGELAAHRAARPR